jgi:gamma-glutamylcysteine synthetase
LHLVSGGYICHVSHQLNSVAQTQAIVAQVEREIEQRTTRARMGGDLHLLTPQHPPSLATRTTRRVVQSLFPAGL